MAEGRGERGYMIEWLKGMGYSPDTRMAGAIAEWWGWYTARNDFYDYRVQRGQDYYPVHRETLMPAAAVAEEWSSLLMNERLEIGSPDESMAAVIAEHFTDFGVGRAEFVAESFALGTGALAASVSGVSGDGTMNPHADISVLAHTGAAVMPLTWTDRGCDQCAFASRVEIGGRDYDQCQAHVLVGGTYHILTRLFDTQTHKAVEAEGVIPDLDTRSPLPTFALVRPAIPNTLFAHCAMGASVFSRGISAIKATDEALTSFLVHMRVGRPKMFVQDTMIAKRTVEGPDGVKRTVYDAFGEADDIVYRVPPGEEGAKGMDVVQPDLRTEENERAVSAGLKMLAFDCGLGDNYWSWDSKTGIKTATEVVSESSMLARNMVRHQNSLEKAIVRIVRGVAGICRGVCGAPVNAEAEVSVDFDDGVITDTAADKQTMLAEIAAGVVPKWMYLVAFFKKSEEEARAMLPEAVLDQGF